MTGLLLLWSVVSTVYAAPIVVTFDNGGFNLPLYTGRYNGSFEQPSVARQITADIARLQGASPRVFSYLPPGRADGSSSNPTEVVPRRPDCVGADCACAPGENCWGGLDVNRSPTASTSLFQAATGMRAAVGPGPRIEVHFTDLFEEDPSGVEHKADADRCVTRESTRKAVEALLDAKDGSIDHVAVGRLRARIDPPRVGEGGVVAFAQTSGSCWAGKRVRNFGGGGGSVDFDMAVVVIGVGTAAEDAEVQRFIRGIQRQIGDPLSLELVVVREPSTVGIMAPQYLGAKSPDLYLPPPLERSTPCSSVTTELRLWSGGKPLVATAQAGCDDAAVLHLSPDALSSSFRNQAGLSPTVGSMQIAGEVAIEGDLAAIEEAVRKLETNPALDRPLPHWASLAQALRFDGSGRIARPRLHRVRIEQITVNDVDDRPWMLAFLLSLFPFVLVVIATYAMLARIAGNRAFQRHLEAGSAQGRPIAAVLAEAGEEARAGWFGRLMVSVTLAGFLSSLCMLLILILDGLRVG